MSPTHRVRILGSSIAAALRARGLIACALLAVIAAQASSPAAQTAAPPGVPASPQTTADLQRVLTDALARFEARDTAGVLAHVSEDYRTSPLTKRLVRDQLNAMFALYDTVRAKIHIDDVRMVGDHAWIWSTGEVEGRLAMVRRWMPVLSWERELEVARRENGRWRLYGYQQ